MADGKRQAKVRKRSIGENGEEIGDYNVNPLLNTALYDVEFDDGTVRQYRANIIAQNLYEQIDDDGYFLTKLEAIIDYKKDSDALSQDESIIVTKSGQKRIRQSTRGWKMLVKFTDGSNQWVPLRILKETNPVEVAEFAVARQIHQGPAFRWWVPYVLRKKDAIISSITHKLRRVTHKYGIKIPRNTAEAKAFDAKSRNMLWWDSITKDMKNVRVAFEEFEGDVKDIPKGYQHVDYHLIVYIKMG